MSEQILRWIEESPGVHMLYRNKTEIRSVILNEDRTSYMILNLEYKPHLSLLHSDKIFLTLQAAKDTCVV